MFDNIEYIASYDMFVAYGCGNLSSDIMEGCLHLLGWFNSDGTVSIC